MTRRGRFGVAAGLAFAGPLLLAFLMLAAPSGLASSDAGWSLQFGGTRAETADIVTVTLDDPATSADGPPVDVGAEPFTFEFWMRARASDNTEADVWCGENEHWLQGNVVVDRNREGANRKYGISVADGHVIFGVSSTDDRSICGSANVLDDQWHHVAAGYRPDDGKMWLWVDGKLDASGQAPAGDISYPDNAIPPMCANGPCTSDTYLAFGSSKLRQYPAFKGSLDEIRVSNVLRYTSSFARPKAPFETDSSTVGLYHFDEGQGTTVHDDSGALGGPSTGTRKFDGADRPRWNSSSPFSSSGAQPTPTPTSTSTRLSSRSPTPVPTGTESGGRLIIDRDGDGKISPEESAAPEGGEPGASPSPSHKTRAPSAIAGFAGNPAVPPVAIALLGLGIAIFIAARFLRSDRL